MPASSSTLHLSPHGPSALSLSSSTQSLDIPTSPLARFSLLSPSIPSSSSESSLNVSPTPIRKTTNLIIRIPFGCLILAVVLAELLAYTTIRAVVFLIEKGTRQANKVSKAQKALKEADTLEKYKTAALKLDELTQNEKWKSNAQSPVFDNDLVGKLTSKLRKLRKSAADGQESSIKQLSKLLLSAALRNDMAGIENKKLYCSCYWGTKHIVEAYLEEVQDCLDLIMHSTMLTPTEKYKFFKIAGAQYGQTALCLSGGAAFGYYHLGVAKSLFENGCLPRVITGTSSGSLIAAMIAVRTDEELLEIFDPEIGRRFTICDESWLTLWSRYWKRNHMFSYEHSYPKVAELLFGDMTFMEAYQKTGRILNIPLVSDGDKSPPLVCNYKTTPHVLIGTAMLASSAIPGILPAIELKRKTSSGRILPYKEVGAKWRDGSLRTDIPIVQLNLLFNVTYTCVSQVNPHIVLFFFDREGSSGVPLRHAGSLWKGGYFLSSIEHYLKLDLLKYLRLMRDLQLMPSFASQDWSYVYLQRFHGNCTIVPKLFWNDYTKIITNPSQERMDLYIRKGEQRTWPKLSMLMNRMKIEKTIFDFKQAVLAQKQGKSTPERFIPTPAPGNSPYTNRKEILESDDDEEDAQQMRYTDIKRPHSHLEKAFGHLC